MFLSLSKLSIKIPWQVVVLDDGMSWLGTAHNDPNGKIGRAWDAVWSKSDGWAGLAGLPPYFGGRGDIWSLLSKNDEEEEDDLVLDETESIVSDDEDSMSSYDVSILTMQHVHDYFALVFSLIFFSWSFV